MVLPWMHTTQPMVSPFKISPFSICLFIVAIQLTGCVSYRFMRAVEGRLVPPIPEECHAGKTTLQEALEMFGAPDQLLELEGKDVLICRRSSLAESGLSFGIPMTDMLSFDVSASGSLACYDLLLLFFTPDGILREIVSEKGSEYPYLKTTLSDKEG